MLWTKYKGFIGSKLTSVQKLSLNIKINHKYIKRGIIKIQPFNRRKHGYKKQSAKFKSQFKSAH